MVCHTPTNKTAQPLLVCCDTITLIWVRLNDSLFNTQYHDLSMEAYVVRYYSLELVLHSTSHWISGLKRSHNYSIGETENIILDGTPAKRPMWAPNTVHPPLSRLTLYTANCKPTVVDTRDAPSSFYNSNNFVCGFSYPDQIPSANFSACCSGSEHFYNGCFHWCTTTGTSTEFNQCLGQHFEFLNGLAYGSLCNRDAEDSGVEQLKAGWKTALVSVLIASIMVHWYWVVIGKYTEAVDRSCTIRFHQLI